jgi:hypothetical protein
MKKKLPIPVEGGVVLYRIILNEKLNKMMYFFKTDEYTIRDKNSIALEQYRKDWYRNSVKYVTNNPFNKSFVKANISITYQLEDIYNNELFEFTVNPSNLNEIKNERNNFKSNYTNKDNDSLSSENSIFTVNFKGVSIKYPSNWIAEKEVLQEGLAFYIDCTKKGLKSSETFSVVWMKIKQTPLERIKETIEEFKNTENANFVFDTKIESTEFNGLKAKSTYYSVSDLDNMFYGKMTTFNYKSYSFLYFIQSDSLSKLKSEFKTIEENFKFIDSFYNETSSNQLVEPEENFVKVNDIKMKIFDWTINKDVKTKEINFRQLYLINNNDHISVMSTTHDLIKDIDKFSDYWNEKTVRNMKPYGLIFVSQNKTKIKFKGINAVNEKFIVEYKPTGVKNEMNILTFKLKKYFYSINYYAKPNSEKVINSIIIEN